MADIASRLGQAVAVAILALIAILTFATPARAHAELISTTPANGAALPTAPAEVVLRFTEPVTPVRGGTRLLDGSGRAVRTGQAVRLPGAGDAVRFPLPASLPDGAYTVSWRVVSLDSHPVYGSLVFTVGDASAAPSLPASELTGADSAVVVAFWVARWVGYLSLALLVGGLFFLVACWPAGRADPVSWRVLGWSWIAALAAADASLLLQGAYAQGVSISGVLDPALLEQTLGTDYGVFTVARVILLLVIGALALARWSPLRSAAAPPAPSADAGAAGRPAPSRAFLGGLAVATVALVATWSGTGHARSGPLLASVSDATHLLAMALWIGGLALLLTRVLPKGRTVPAEQAAAVLPRFSRTATVAVAVLVGTGIYQAWRGLGSVSALPGSSYGKILFFKLAAFGVLLWLGAMSRSVVQARYVRPVVLAMTTKPRPTRPGAAAPAGGGRARREEQAREVAALAQLRQSVRLEALIVLVVLGITAVLTGTPPGTHGHAGEAAAAPPAAAAPAEPVNRELPMEGGGSLGIAFDPARIGQNQLNVSVFDAKGLPREVPEVTARLSRPQPPLGPYPVTLTRTGRGEFTAGDVTVAGPGNWTLEISVRTSEFDITKVTTDIVVG